MKAGESDNSKGHRGRVHHTDEKSLANPAEQMDPYKKNEAVSMCVLNGGKSYSLIVSGYDRNDPLGGTLTVESDQPLLVRQLTPEGHGMVKQVFHDTWEFNSSGGCSNFQTFGKNPAYAVNIRQNDTFVFFRLMVTSEVSAQGMEKLIDTD